VSRTGSATPAAFGSPPGPNQPCNVAGITDRVRPFHDLRHTAITNDAAAGASELAVMAKAGHRSMSTTETYLRLAGVVFREEASALEQRLLGSVESSTDLANLR
jgi:integrase